MNSKGKHLVLLGLVIGLVAVLASQQLYGMPNFARKYSMSCSGCHNPVPRLNEFGFKFRAAGFRMPDEIGKGDTSSNIGDYIAARTQARYDLSRSEAPSGTSTDKNQLTFHEFTFYPLTGAFAQNFSSLVELSFLPDEPAEIENGYVRYNTGKEEEFFSARFGIMHPFEGYGASDRPLGLARPLFQTNAANSNQSTVFTAWGFDEVGLELGYTINRTSLRATVFNGLLSNGEPAQGGDLSKPVGSPSSNSKDIQLFATQMLTDNGGGLSGYFYAGWLDLPTGVPGAGTFQNTFQRYAVYGSYPVEKALFLGGYQYGKDKSFDRPLNRVGADFNSSGVFAEGDYNVAEQLWLGLRYDWFDPATNVNDNRIQAITAIGNYSFDNGLQFIGEYQRKDSRKGAAGSQKDDAFQIRMIFIY